MTLIKDLIDIPDRVFKDQYVLRLSEGVTRPDETLSDYVVTPELTTCFDAALLMIRSAVTNRTSKAAFLHGSFGTGKSHCMAVLHLILQGNPAARGIIEQLDKTVPEIKAWEPAQRTARRPRAAGGGTRSSSRRRTEAVDSPEE